MTASLALVNFNSKEVKTSQADAALRRNGYQQPAGIRSVLGSILCPQLGRFLTVGFGRSSIRKQTASSRPNFGQYTEANTVVAAAAAFRRPPSPSERRQLGRELTVRFCAWLDA